MQRIGLHPFASQPSKLWPAERWRELARELARRGMELWGFSGPDEAPELTEIFQGLPVKLRATDIRQYCADILQLDLVICLDSLAMHLAHRFGVPSITINAGNPPELYAVPSGRTLASSGGCPHHPCFNVAPCRAPRAAHVCVNAITPQLVLAAVDARICSAAATSGVAGGDSAAAALAGGGPALLPARAVPMRAGAPRPPAAPGAGGGP